MKITYINGNFSHHDHGLGVVVKRTVDVFTELEVEIKTIELGVAHPPHFDGEAHVAIDKIINEIRSADGIVLASTAQLFAPTALMQVFLEYLTVPEYAEVFDGKHCMLVALSVNGGEKSALDYLSRVVTSLGGLTVGKIGLQAHHIEEMEQNTGGFIDRACEDFFRAIRQKRQYILPMDYPIRASVASSTVMMSPAVAHHAVLNSPPREPVVFTEEHEKDVEELSRLFSQKYASEDFDSIPIASASAANESSRSGADPMTKSATNPFASAHVSDRIPARSMPPSPPVFEGNSLEELTAALPKRLNTKLSAGLMANIQFVISGDKAFQGYLCIHSNECTYEKGEAPAPDMTVMTDSKTWLDILESKNTAQKAFMVGGLKVRGDFVLLSKFDTLFT